jgi:hypothetical protein
MKLTTGSRRGTALPVAAGMIIIDVDVVAERTAVISVTERLVLPISASGEE